MALADNIITTVNASLAANLSWLDNSYGKVQRFKEKAADGSIRTYPGVYNGAAAGDHANLLPDRHKGNYCYWEVLDDQNYEIVNRTVKAKFRFKLVFWFYWPDLYADWTSRSIEEVKAQILNVLVHSQYTNMIDLYTIHEQADRIFSGYTAYKSEGEYNINEAKRQPLMKPYGGLAFEGEVIGNVACGLDLPIPEVPFNIVGLIPFVHSTSEQIYPFERELSNTPIYVRTWSLSSGEGGYETLTGLVSADITGILKVEYRALNTVNGIYETGLTQAVPTGSGGYKVFTPDFWTNIYVRVYYTKS